jgi:hypothetical protein
MELIALVLGDHIEEGVVRPSAVVLKDETARPNAKKLRRSCHERLAKHGAAREYALGGYPGQTTSGKVRR